MSNKNPKGVRCQALSKYGVLHNHYSRQAPGHEGIFNDIQTLARTNLSTYSTDVVTENREKPWRQPTLKRSEAIRDRVVRGLDDRLNESDWRSSIENLVFQRFEVEVVCHTCRARLWRSELEAAATDTNISLKSLKERRLAREPCRCLQHRGGNERCDNGLNELFGNRSEEYITHEEDIMRILQKTHEKPDRVWGIRTTKRIEKILGRETRDGNGCIEDNIKMSPFTGDASRLLYPFLILEAKSEKAADNFSDINLQTGFIARNLLSLQQDLALQVPDSLRANARENIPLVWVVASKGDLWRVSAGYISTEESDTKYHILDLWDGRLAKQEDALRLLLILDYIFDWARDIYRTTILHCLSTLGGTPTSSLRSDTDILSVRQFQIDSATTQEHDPVNADTAPPRHALSDTLPFYDKPGMALRDARRMCYRVVGLQLTKDTLDDFLNSVCKSAQDEALLMRQLVRSLCSRECWCVSAECLNRLEAEWTKRDREPDAFENPQGQFLAFFNVKSYFGILGIDFSAGPRYDRWLQIHALEFVAVTEDVIKRLKQETNQQDMIELADVPHFSSEEVIDVFNKVRNAPARQCLTAACLSRQVSSSHTSIGNGIDVSNASDEFDLHGLLTQATKFRPLLRQLSHQYEPSSEQFPESVYRRLKVGRREPKEEFLRISTEFIEQDWDNPECAFWPGKELLIRDGQMALHVYRKERCSAILHCIFLLNPAATTQQPDEVLQELHCVGTNPIRIGVSAGLCFDLSCTEILCTTAQYHAQKILYHLAGCYFEYVNPDSGIAWREFFNEEQLASHITDFDPPVQNDRGKWLDRLRSDGDNLGLGERLIALVNVYAFKQQYHRSYARPSVNLSLMPGKDPTICDCHPSSNRHNRETLRRRVAGTSPLPSWRESRTEQHGNPVSIADPRGDRALVSSALDAIMHAFTEQDSMSSTTVTSSDDGNSLDSEDLMDYGDSFDEQEDSTNGNESTVRWPVSSASVAHQQHNDRSLWSSVSLTQHPRIVLSYNGLQYLQSNDFINKVAVSTLPQILEIPTPIEGLTSPRFPRLTPTPPLSYPYPATFHSQPPISLAHVTPSYPPPTPLPSSLSQRHRRHLPVPRPSPSPAMSNSWLPPSTATSSSSDVPDPPPLATATDAPVSSRKRIDIRDIVNS